MKRLSFARRAAFKAAVRQFLQDLPSRRFRPGLRVKGVRTHPGVFELTWAPDGRATFEYGVPIVSGEVHNIWRRVGTHEIFEEP